MWLGSTGCYWSLLSSASLATGAAEDAGLLCRWGSVSLGYTLYHRWKHRNAPQLQIEEKTSTSIIRLIKGLHMWARKPYPPLPADFFPSHDTYPSHILFFLMLHLFYPFNFYFSFSFPLYSFFFYIFSFFSSLFFIFWFKWDRLVLIPSPPPGWPFLRFFGPNGTDIPSRRMVLFSFFWPKWHRLVLISRSPQVESRL